MPERIAAIDFGTNTARLLIADRQTDGSFSQVYLKRTIVRLGGGFDRETGLSPEAVVRGLSCLKDFRADIDLHSVDSVRAVATSAVRDAANGPDFVGTVFSETGIRLSVIDGSDEGAVTLLGVLAGLDVKPENLFLFDVGGGSTEYILARGSSPCFVRSLPLGVVRLTEGQSSVDGMSSKIHRELACLGEIMANAGIVIDPDATTLAGTAGTATTLAAISLEMEQYDYRKVNNHLLERKEIRRILEMLLPLSPLERLSVPGLEPGREDLIIAGILVTLHTMELFGFDQMKVSDYGLLEGIIASREGSFRP